MTGHRNNTFAEVSEQEGALYEVVRLLLLTVVEMGADKTVLLQRMRAMAEASRALGRNSGAATIELLMRSVTSPVDYTAVPPS
jgi:hypothetical protein